MGAGAHRNVLCCHLTLSPPARIQVSELRSQKERNETGVSPMALWVASKGHFHRVMSMNRIIMKFEGHRVTYFQATPCTEDLSGWGE